MVLDALEVQNGPMNSQLHFEEMGVGPPIVFVAGLGGEGRFWSRQMAHFANTHRVICYDHRGCGRSTATDPNRTIDSMSADLEVLLCDLKVEQSIVVGHSTGGAIAQVLAADRSDLVSRVVLSSTWLRADDYMRDLFRLRIDVMRTMGPNAYAALGKILCYGPHRPTADPADAASPRHVAVATPARMSIDYDTVWPRIEALLSFDGRSRAPPAAAADANRRCARRHDHASLPLGGAR
ncbi:MAG: alpha/beta fold hydrolase [Burkholderiales bacterium]|nr:alpha/beta fold hydrolase [Burkholderiales bacterium]